MTSNEHFPRFLPATTFTEPVEQFHKRCGTCLKTKEEAGSLSTCSLCRQQWYCSKACQKRDWSSHKTYCSHHRDLIDSTVVDGNSMWRDLSIWERTYQAEIGSAMVYSFNLPQNPEAHQSNALVLHLRYDPTRTKAVERFKVWRMEKKLMSDVLAVYGDPKYNADLAKDDERRATRSQIRWGDDYGGLGHVCFLVQLDDQLVIRISGITFTKPLATQAIDQSWPQRLLLLIGNLSPVELLELFIAGNCIL